MPARQSCGGSDLLLFLACYPDSPRFPRSHPAALGMGLGIAPNARESRTFIRRPPCRLPSAGLLGLPWADGGGMGRLLPQLPANLDQAAVIILEPEAAPEA